MKTLKTDFIHDGSNDAGILGQVRVFKLLKSLVLIFVLSCITLLPSCVAYVPGSGHERHERSNERHGHDDHGGHDEGHGQDEHHR